MKLLLTILCIAIGAKGAQVSISFNSFWGIGYITMDMDYPNGAWVPSTLNYTLHKEFTDTTPATFDYLINDQSVLKGEETFCQSNLMTPGGLAMAILKESMQLTDECPVEKFTKKTCIPWKWISTIDANWDIIFKMSTNGPDGDANMSNPAGGDTDGDADMSNPAGGDTDGDADMSNPAGGNTDGDASMSNPADSDTDGNNAGETPENNNSGGGPMKREIGDVPTVKLEIVVDGFLNADYILQMTD